MLIKINKPKKVKLFALKQTAYYQCVQCKLLFVSKDTSLYQAHHGIDEELLTSKSTTMYTLEPIEVLNNLILVGRDGQWKLTCERCDNEIGCIREDRAELYSSRILLHIVKYEQTDKVASRPAEKGESWKKECQKIMNPKQLKAKKLNELLAVIYRYLHVALRSLEDRVCSTDLTALSNSAKQLQSFLKFYRKWMRRDQFVQDSLPKQSKYSSFNSAQALLASIKKQELKQ